MTKSKIYKIVLVALSIGVVFFVGKLFIGVSSPSDFQNLDDLATLYPDYVGVVFPPNIAPANFRIEEEGDAFCARVTGDNGASLFVSGQNVEFPEKKWKRLLEGNRGGSLRYEIFIRRQGEWFHFKEFQNQVSEDPVDPYVAYRLVEPGFDYSYRMALAQRCLENFNERLFVDNRSATTSACVNCHSFQNYHTDRFSFHFRRPDAPDKGGTILVDGDKIVKATGYVDDLKNTCSYPAWRPTGDFIAFSSNVTRQSFHSLSTQKIEVYDGTSDLVLLDPRKNEVRVVEKTETKMETFPFWSPDGLFLYYSCADYLPKASSSDVEALIKEASNRTAEIRYNICRRSFDEKTCSFGAQETVVDAASQGRSALFPRISPDGRFLVYTLAESGTFPIWRPEADLCLLDLTTGESRVMSEVNSSDTDSYHSWSSTGRWLIFSSRRDDGFFTRFYLTHIDAQGRGSKPFVLPQRDPTFNRQRHKSYNIPEFTVEPVKLRTETIMKATKRDAEKTRAVSM